jgi:hypothetical protein
MAALLNLVVFTVVSCVVLWLVFNAVQFKLRLETINRMLILADGMSMKAANSVQAGDMNALQMLLGEAISQPDVAYSFIRDAGGRILASTFEGNAVPDELKNINELGKGMPFGTQETRLVSGDMVRSFVDIAAPLAGGSLGSLHIGWNVDIQRASIRRMFFPFVIVAAAFSCFAAAIISAILMFKVTDRILRPARRP